MATTLRRKAPASSASTVPPTLHDRAMQDLSFIRQTMEGATSFTDVPGWGLVGIGATAIAASVVAAMQGNAGRWITVWVIEAVVAALCGLIGIRRKMKRNARPGGAPVVTAAARKFMLGFWPAIVAGAVITLAVVEPRGLWSGYSTVPRVLPGVWLLLYGVGIITAGAYSVRAVPLMGIGLMAFGTATLLVPSLPVNVMLMLGFGVWQMAFGVWIARRHGG